MHILKFLSRLIISNRVGIYGSYIDQEKKTVLSRLDETNLCCYDCMVRDEETGVVHPNTKGKKNLEKKKTHTFHI